MTTDVAKVYAHWDTKGHFLQSVILPKGAQNPCQTQEISFCTNNGLHELMDRCTTYSWKAQKIEVFETLFP